MLYVSELCSAGRAIFKCVDIYRGAEINKFSVLLWNMCAGAFFSKPLRGKMPLSPSVFSVNEVFPAAGLCFVPNCSY